MKILAIDTATEACSAALYCSGTITVRHQITSRKHSELILTMVDELLNQSAMPLTQIDALAFGCGPGTFTGVRLAAAVTQGLSISANCPVLPVSTLAALAQGAVSKSKHVACAIDARMDAVYWALYVANDNDVMQLLGKETVCKPELIDLSDIDSFSQSKCWLGIGSGWRNYTTRLTDKMGKYLSGVSTDNRPSAESVCILAVDAYKCGATLLDPEMALPVYLRDNITS